LPFHRFVILLEVEEAEFDLRGFVLLDKSYNLRNIVAMKQTKSVMPIILEEIVLGAHTEINVRNTLKTHIEITAVTTRLRGTSSWYLR